MHTETWTFDEGEFAMHIQGEGPPLLLIHGIGPGTSIAANFGPLLPALAARRTIYGMDLIGFGASPYKARPPYCDFPLWVAQARAAIARIGGESLAVWGQSLGAAVALAAAAREPRVAKVVGTGAGGGATRLNPALDGFWTTPDSPAALRIAMAAAVYNAEALSDAQIATRYEVLQGGVGRYFAAMMAEGKEALLRSCLLSPELLGEVAAEVLLIHGRDDRPVPYRESALHLLDHLARCKLVLLARCGHNPMLEHGEEVTALALGHLEK